MSTSRSHLYSPVTDSEGNVTPNVKITVYEPGSTQLLQQPIYDSPSGSTLLTNPFTTSSGFVDFYLASPQDVSIGLSVQAQGGTERRIEDVAVLPPSHQLVRSPQGFQIMNPPLSGGFLQASEDRKAYWVSADDILATHATPTVTLKQYDFSASYLDDLVVASGTSQYADVALEVKPSGFGFLQALSFTGKVSAPLMTFPERGWVAFVYKVISGAGGQNAARMKVSLDDGKVWTTTPASPDFVNDWAVGYLEIVERGSHRISFEQIAGTDPTSKVLLGPVSIRYGNNIPAHTHEGPYAGTVCLGTDSLVTGEKASALGALAQASGQGTATGYQARASTRGVALGSGAYAGQDSVAAGYQAGGASGATNWVAYGAQARSLGSDAAAVGYGAAAGVRAVGLGSQSQAGGLESIALGARASAAGTRSVAIGTGAQAPYDYSLALGPGVSTQAAHEARLGDEDTVTVIPGSLRHIGPQAVLGATDGELAFYGAAPVAQPVVRGSRSGNQVLTQVLAALDAMGLIEDRSTAS